MLPSCSSVAQNRRQQTAQSTRLVFVAFLQVLRSLPGPFAHRFHLEQTRTRHHQVRRQRSRFVDVVKGKLGKRLHQWSEILVSLFQRRPGHFATAYGRQQRGHIQHRYEQPHVFPMIDRRLTPISSNSFRGIRRMFDARVGLHPLSSRAIQTMLRLFGLSVSYLKHNNRRPVQLENRKSTHFRG